MAYYHFTVKDETNGSPISAHVEMLDPLSGSPIDYLGSPVSFDIDRSGSYEMNSEQSSLAIRVSSPGYITHDFAITPGSQELRLSRRSSSDGSPGAQGSIMDNIKAIIQQNRNLITVIVIAALLYFAYKSGLIG